MFTGLIEATGEVLSFTRGAGAARLTIAVPEAEPGAGPASSGIVARLSTGDSVSVSGVCLTALGIEPAASPPRFSADLAAETIARTTLSRLHPGSVVNLEMPTPAGSPLGGHVVQGHVDGVGTLLALDQIAAGVESSDWILRVRVPQDLMRYVVEKGSIAMEGISLTVAGVREDEIRIAILPHTYAATNLHALAIGDGVNIEVDVLAKYAESRGQAEEKRELTLGYLIANGY